MTVAIHLGARRFMAVAYPSAVRHARDPNADPMELVERYRVLAHQLVHDGLRYLVMHPEASA